MFNRSRRKIILSIMGSLILLFVVTLSVILLASYREIQQKNADMLERYVALYALENQPERQDDPAQGQEPPGKPSSDDPGMEPPPEKPSSDDPGMETPPEKPSSDDPGQEPPLEKPPLDGGPDYQLSTFYSVALAEDGSVLSVDNGERTVYSEEDLIGIAREILAGNRSSGRIGHLTYLVSARPEYTLVAFMDNTVTEGSMQTLLRNVLIVGGAAIVVLFFISLFLSKRIIRPLEENDRQQRQFVSDASHELKTPVAVIDTNAEMLSREIGENEWLANIQYENERMGGLVTQLLDLSRAENADVLMEEIDYSRIVTGETLAFENLAFDQGKEIQSDIEEGLLLTGNRTQLTQLTSILMDNAIRHSTGSKIELTLKRQGHQAVLMVVNEGDEISPEKLAHLFDRFYRVDEARNSEGQHYGLGLSIAKAVVAKHGGSIDVSCQGGKVRFTASIPIKK